MYKPFNKETAEGREVFFLAEDLCHGKTYAPARIICYDRKSNDNASLVVLSETKPGFEHFLVLYDDGTDCYGKQRLFMAPVKREEWVHIYPLKGGSGYNVGSLIYPSEKSAIDDMAEYFDGYVKAVKVREWEE